MATPTAIATADAFLSANKTKGIGLLTPNPLGEADSLGLSTKEATQMEVMWWLLVAVTVIWHLRQGIRRLQAASQRIDADIAAFNRAHPPHQQGPARVCGEFALRP